MGKLQINDVSLLAEMENAGFLKPAAVSVSGSKYYSKDQIKNFEYLYSLYLDFCRKNKEEHAIKKDIKVIVPTAQTNNDVLDKLEFDNDTMSPKTLGEMQPDNDKLEYTEQIVPPTCIERGYTKHICVDNESKTYCDNYIEKLGHDYEKIIIRKTCDEDGIAKYVCKRCKNEYSKKIPKQKHDFILSETIAPDCLNPGKKIFACRNCEQTKVEELKPLGHDYEEKVIQKESCTKEKIVKLICKRCGVSETVKTPPTGHDYSEIKRNNATCEEEGSITYKCSKCGKAYDKKIPAKGHDYTLNVINPTCVTPGKTIHTCKFCNKSYESDETQALGHNYKEEIVSYPTELEGGLKRYTCINCGDTYEEYIPPILTPSAESILDKLDALEEENNKLIREENSKAEELKKKLNEEPVGPKIVQGKKRRFV